MKPILISLITIGLVYGAWRGFHLRKIALEQKEYKEVLAEINRINYGLFNMELWKDKAMEIFTNRIDHFKISPQVYKDVESELAKYLRNLYVEYISSGKLINQFIDDAEKEGKLNKMFAKLIRDNVGPQIKNLGIEAKIPSIASTLSAELKANEPKLKGYLQEALKNMLFEGDQEKMIDRRMKIFEKYGHTTIEETNTDLAERVATLDVNINKEIKTVYAIVLGCCLLCFLTYFILGGPAAISLVTMGSIILLLLGVTMPMIDIDARLNAFRMDIVGSEVSFDEQYLYYQSKSILEVTKTLIEGRGIDLKIVGIMILLFSIVVPLLKLILSTFILFSRRIRKNKLAQGIVYHLGKWSMADVFVVAMFMAYIGFYGIVTAQLGEIGRNQTGYAVETLNYSRLSPGALFFTTYCILSIITGILVKRWVDKDV